MGLPTADRRAEASHHNLDPNRWCLPPVLRHRGHDRCGSDDIFASSASKVDFIGLVVTEAFECRSAGVGWTLAFKVTNALLSECFDLGKMMFCQKQNVESGARSKWLIAEMEGVVILRSLRS